MTRFCNTALLSAALAFPVVMAPTALQAQDHPRTYHDKAHNDDHQWNDHENRAYRIYLKENHRKYNNFSRQHEEDQQAYWGWASRTFRRAAENRYPLTPRYRL